MKYYKCYLTEEEVKSIEAACGQSNFEFGYNENCLESLPTVAVSEEEYKSFWSGDDILEGSVTDDYLRETITRIKNNINANNAHVKVLKEKIEKEHNLITELEHRFSNMTEIKSAYEQGKTIQCKCRTHKNSEWVDLIPYEKMCEIREDINEMWHPSSYDYRVKP